MAKQVIISGGGTGGHVFPAIAIANALKKIDATIDIRFIGAKGKIEMEKVPRAGYPIDGLWISGFQRKLTIKNLSFPIKLIHSLWQVKSILRKHQPNVVIGTGGYASGPALRVAANMGIPTVIQEQNSYAGVTNKLLAQKAKAICVAYENMEQFFPKEKIHVTGNPVRKNLVADSNKRQEAYEHFNLDPAKKTVLVMGGSLGARTINQAMEANVEIIKHNSHIQFIWQMGKLYEDDFMDAATANLVNVHPTVFIDRMDFAYAVADIMVCRAGALTISEILLVGKPAILVPSPNVAEDHQTKNAMALVNKEAALIVTDKTAKEKMVAEAIDLLNNDELVQKLKINTQLMAKPNADETIAKIALSAI